MSRSRSRSRRQEAILRRRRAQRRWRVMAIGLGLLVVGLVAWGIVAAVQRATLARSVESRPPVIGTPLVGGMDASFTVPTPVPRRDGPEPRLVLPRDSHHFGVLSVNGAPAEHAFRVLNSGQADLIVSAVSTSCGCTTARLSADRIPPGESAELLVSYDPSFHRQTGDFVREVYLYTSDPRQPEVVVSISASVR